MDEYVKTLSDETRRRYRLYAYASTWFGCFSDVVMDSSAIIILYIAALGGGNGMVMFSTSLVGIMSMFFLIPTSRLVDKLGIKKVIGIACYIAFASYLTMAAGAFCGSWLGKYVAIFGCMCYCVSKPLWMGAWFPLLTNILLPSERGDFLGFMRFSYNILTGTVLFAVGVAMGEKPPIWLLQAVIAITGMLVLGRIFFIAKIKIPPHVPTKHNLRKAVSTAFKNSSMVAFCAYVCFLSVAFMPVIPLAFVYMKNGLDCGDNVVQIISSIGIGGQILSFLVYGRLVRRIGIRNMQLLVHGLFVAIPAALFFCGNSTPFLPEITGFLLFSASFAYGCFYCSFSQETLALARPGNVAMATAVCQTYQLAGTAIGRSATSFVLGYGILSAAWTVGGTAFNHFQTLFLICAAMSLLSAVLLVCIPSVMPENDNYYNP